jgi:hypothetical protein
MKVWYEYTLYGIDERNSNRTESLLLAIVSVIADML